MDLISQCTLRVANAVWRPGHGGFAFTVVCKATFELRPDVSPLAAVQEPVAFADVYVGEGGGLAIASDLVPAKKRPEVLLTGHAYAPEGRPVPSVLARLVVGEIDKSIQVVGDRHFGRNGKLSDPEYFTAMPLVWERADGGPNTLNPAGISLGSAARPDALGRVPAPNLLPVGLWLKSRGDTIPPVGFGPIAPLWPSRTACLHRHAAGWDPGRWHEQPLPADIDLAYFNAAPLDQQRTLPFGEEGIYLENLHPRFAQLSTRLAQVTPVATVDYGAGAQALQLRCDTLIIDTDSGLAMLVWRAHVLLDRPDRPGRVVVTVQRAPQVSIPAWDASVTTAALDFEPTIVPAPLRRLAVAVPFSRAAVTAPVHAAPVAPVPLSVAEMGTMGLPAEFIPPAAALPFGASPGESASRREAPPAEGALALPFVRPLANEARDGLATQPRPDLREMMLPQTANAPPAVSWDSGRAAPVAPVPPSVAEMGTMGLPTGFTLPAAALPFGASPGESASRREALPAENAFALPLVRPLANEDRDALATQPRPNLREVTLPQAASAPPAASWDSAPLEALLPAVAPPAPLPRLGSLAAPEIVSPQVLSTTHIEVSEPSPPAQSEPPLPHLPLDRFPIATCARIAASIARRRPDAAAVLADKGISADLWSALEKHWADAVREESKRGKTALLQSHDAAYVAQLEAERGVITPKEYARLLIAVERGDEGQELAELELPRGAILRIQRLWLARRASDAAFNRTVRAAMAAETEGDE